MTELPSTIMDFMRGHEDWLIPIALALAFAESLVLLSLLVPATVVLIGMGALMGASDIAFAPVWLSAAGGAAAGDWLSFWLGNKYKNRIAHWWPLSRNPTLLPRGKSFFLKWGTPGVFIGRFFGPLRASVPLVAGICDMPKLRFQLANVASALVWAAAILAPGAFGVRWFTNLIQ